VGKRVGGGSGGGSGKGSRGGSVGRREGSRGVGFWEKEGVRQKWEREWGKRDK